MAGRSVATWIQKLSPYAILYAQAQAPFGPMILLQPESVPRGGHLVPGIAIGALVYIAGLAGIVIVRLSNGSRSVELARLERRIPEYAVPLGLLLLSTATAMVGAFSSSYWVLSVQNSASFSHPLSKLDAIYMTVSIFTTTGFGDLVPVSQQARSLVLWQMVAGFILITFVISVAAGRMWRTRANDHKK